LGNLIVYNGLSLFPKVIELQQLLKYYDTNGDGSVSYEEFLAGLRDNLTPRKLAIVERIFRHFDKNNSGVAQVNDLLKSFDGAKNQDLKHFLDSLGGSISKQEFVGYYTDIAMGVPSDEYFVRVLEDTWGLTEDEQSTVF